jgi:hypothetical protein
MNKFLDALTQPKLNQEDSSHLNRLIAINETEAIIVAKKRGAQDMMNSWLNFNRPLKKNVYKHSSNFSRK